VDFHELYDVRALRVITRTVKDCYAALGVVHGLWPHIPREFDDYIAHPKGNNYRSLHTAVVGPGGKTLEVQIRTEEMHRQAELGVAAHWRYKEGGRQDPAFEEKIAWLRQVLEPREEGDAQGDFLDRFKTEVFHDRVYVLSPQGRVVDLPRGSTPLDFAYAIHSEVGHRCRGAKVGGSIVPLTYTLQNGDQVEILTARNGTPSRDWLNPALGYLHTSRARAKVRAWFKVQDLDKNIAAGRDLLDRDLRRLGAGDVAHDKLAQRLGFAQVNDLYAALGRGDMGPGQVAGAVREHVLPEREEPEPSPPRPRRREAPSDDVVIAGVGNLMTHLARCCKPLPPDPIMGYITQGHGVTIHRRDCPNALNLESRQPSRVIEVEWGAAPAKAYPVDVDIQAYDRRGLLRDITLLLAGEKVNVTGVNSHSDPRTGIAHIAMTVEVPDIETLSRVLGQLGRLHNLIEVRRRT
jgi:GTP pyrophosphokinase